MQSSNDKDYNVFFDKTLLYALNIHGIVPEDAIHYFSGQIQDMLTTEPNLPKGKPRGKYANLSKGTNIQNCDAWVLRSFYPSTHVMFKITIVNMELHDVWGGGTTPHKELVVSVKFAPMPNKTKLVLKGSLLKKRFADREAETNLLGAFNQESIFAEKFRKPRVMSPKGMKPLDLKQSLRKRDKDESSIPKRRAKTSNSSDSKSRR